MQALSNREPEAPAERWLSVDEIMAHLGVARDTVYRWIDRKGLPAHRVGKLWKFKVSEVDRWVRSGGADETHVNKPLSAKLRRRRP